MSLRLGAIFLLFVTKIKHEYEDDTIGLSDLVTGPPKISDLISGTYEVICKCIHTLLLESLSQEIDMIISSDAYESMSRPTTVSA